MTATDPPDDVSTASEDVAGTAAPRTYESGMAADGTAVDEQTLLRIANVPPDVGWMMVSMGILGVILPGIIGTPFLVTGIAVLAPGGPPLLMWWTTPAPGIAVP
jgi:hypothetical protein